MKKVLCFCLVILLSSTISFSQVKFGGGANAGIAFVSPPKAVKDYYGFGFGFGAMGNVWFTKNIGTRLGLSYHIFPSDKNKFATDIANQFGADPAQAKIEGGNFTSFGIMASALGRYPTEHVSPYGLVGFGLHFNSIGDITASGSLSGTAAGSSSTKFGIHFGGGTEFNIGNVSPFVEVKWVLIFTEVENTSYIPITVGVNLNI